MPPGSRAAALSCRQARGSRVGAGEDVERLVAGEDERDLVGDRVHRIPGRAVVLRLRTARELLRRGLRVAEMDDCFRAAEIRLERGEIDEAVGIARRHVADAANRDDHGVVVRAQHVLQMLERRDLLEQLGFGVGAELAQPGGVIWKWNVRPLGALPFTSSAEALQARNQRWRQVRRDRRARHADREVRAQMCDKVRAHALGGASGQRLLESGERQARRLDRPERDHDGALPAIARRRERDIHRPTVLPDAHAGDPHPVVGLRLGDELLHMAVRDDHQPLARVRVGPTPSARCWPAARHESVLGRR